MTSRALTRAGLPPVPHIDIPFGPRPQFVDSGGFEVDDEAEVNGILQDVPATAEVRGEVQRDDDVVMEEEPAEVTEEIPKEALLSLAESLVLPFSLTQTRQRHLTHLLPHVFSHPPTPSHSKPRPKVVPRGTFLFPTPEPPALPLPFKEYHGHARSLEASAPSTPGPSADGQSPAPAPTKAKSKAKEKDELAPAHEIDCIARVTLTIGPISFPGTELWVGRFVEPRTDRIKIPRKKDPAEKTVKRPRLSASGTPGSASPAPRLGRPPLSAMPKPPPRTTTAAIVRPPVARPPAPRPPAAGSSSGTPVPPSKTDIDPTLIQRVNQAATQHPWLSIIIHKAARNQASKEELAKLGRVVARLGRGESVGEGPLDGLRTGAGPSVRPPTAGPSTGRPPAATSKPPTPAKAAAPPARTANPTPKAVKSPTKPKPIIPEKAGSDTSELTEQSDDEVDMKGPRQVGGGYGPPVLNQTPLSTDGQSSDDSDDDSVDMTGPRQVGGGALDPELVPDVAKKPSVPVAVPNTSAAPAPKAGPSQPPPAVSAHAAIPAVKTAPAAATPNSSSVRPPVGPPSSVAPTATHYNYRPSSMVPQPISQLTPTASSTPQTPRPPPMLPPVPRRQYPLPPPFLLVAFRETPTEKFLLPLGSHSFVSRVGGDHVTHPPPPKPVAPAPATAPILTPRPANGVPPTPNELVASPGGPSAPSGRGRTRATLGRGAKEPKEEIPPPVEEIASTVEVEPPVELKKPTVRTDLPTMPAMAPSAGTVLLSTILPTAEWPRLDWTKLEKRLPFYSRDFDLKPPPAHVKEEPKPAPPEASAAPESPNTTKKEPSSPVRSLRHVRQESQPEIKTNSKALLNLAVEDFLPNTGSVQAVTIRFEGLDDKAWSAMKEVCQAVEAGEMKAISDVSPDLLDSAPPANPQPVEHVPLFASHTIPKPPLPKPLDPKLHPRLRKVWQEKRERYFEKLLKRVSPRTFPRFRLSDYRTDIVDAIADKWAPKPYPISTKPLYLTSPPPEGETEVFFEQEAPVKRKRNQAEEVVTFEMPVSLDQLDERVEMGAKKGVNRRVGKLKVKKEPNPNSKRHGKRYIPGTICEGCGLSGLKVWRRGPSGNGTLCNACGDKFNRGILAELKAPGAASAAKPGGLNGDESQGEGGSGAATPKPIDPDVDAVPSQTEAAGADSMSGVLEVGEKAAKDDAAIVDPTPNLAEVPGQTGQPAEAAGHASAEAATGADSQALP